jgi:hypothetical protein
MMQAKRKQFCFAHRSVFHFQAICPQRFAQRGGRGDGIKVVNTNLFEK